jgi:hypothetical protein
VCGLIGWSGRPPAALILPVLVETAARGPHAHGWAAWALNGWDVTHGDGLLCGPLRDGPVIGHGRLATSGRCHGDRQPVDEAQPLIVDGWVVAHNGTLVVDDGPGTDTARLVQAASPASAGFDVAFARAASGRPQAALLGGPDGSLYAIRLAGARHPAHPLYAQRTPDWTLVASRPWAGSALLPEGRTAL